MGMLRQLTLTRWATMSHYRVAPLSLRITSHEDGPSVAIRDATHLDEVLKTASEEARTRDKLNGVIIESNEGNRLLLVVGGEETVLVFNYSGEDPPYYASKGASNKDEPLMTCFITFQHHTEFSRQHVIPFTEGVRAVHEFLATDDLPRCINWEES
jgi:hypothetical protein